MTAHVSIFGAAFSVIGAIILLLVYMFFMSNMRKTRVSKLACVVMLVSLCALQIQHYMYFTQGEDVLQSRFYCSMLLIIAPAFFFFSREILFIEQPHRWFDALHLIPIIVSQIMPIYAIPALAFTMGFFYTIWFTWQIYRIRHASRRFKFEMFFFGLFALIAIGSLILGLVLPFIPHALFYISYSNAVALAIICKN